ncbi:MAG: membrane dipeptidase [Chloroflexota bacterium]
MWADLHAHYPMRVVSDLSPSSTVERMRERRRGNVGLALSVLYRPFEEMDLSKPYAAPPAAGYFDLLLGDLEEVEAEVATHGRDTIRLVHDREELEGALTDGATALVHAVEGGFHLGDTSEEIARNCATLKRRGVAYVTVAHLFYRQVATNANALPFLPDSLYGLFFPQPKDRHIAERGRAVLKGLVDNRILVDVSHMDPGAVAETFRLLDEELDPERTLPVVSTHAGYRFGRQRYMHDAEALLKIKERGGVVGLIMAQHQLKDGLRRCRVKSFEDTLKVMFSHIDRIAEVTGGYEHIALGSDLDGFVKPTMAGIEKIGDLSLLEAPLRERYGDDAEPMMSGNALRVLRALW